MSPALAGKPANTPGKGSDKADDGKSNPATGSGTGSPGNSGSAPGHIKESSGSTTGGGATGPNPPGNSENVPGQNKAGTDLPTGGDTGDATGNGSGTSSTGNSGTAPGHNKDSSEDPSNGGNAGGPTTSTPSIGGACSLGDLSVAALACSGIYDGNLLNAKSIAEQQFGLAQIGFVWNGDWSPIDATKVEPSANGTYDFAALLSGITDVGIHKGKGGQNGVQGTTFYKIDAGTGIDAFRLLLNGGSSAVLYSTQLRPSDPTESVPEPVSWMMMIAGFGAMGVAMRRHRENAINLA